MPNYENQTLTVVFQTLSAPKFNQAAAKLADLLNQTETIFPGTDLQLKFKISAVSNCEKKGVPKIKKYVLKMNLRK